MHRIAKRKAVQLRFIKEIVVKRCMVLSKQVKIMKTNSDFFARSCIFTADFSFRCLDVVCPCVRLYDEHLGEMRLLLHKCADLCFCTY